MAFSNTVISSGAIQQGPRVGGWVREEGTWDGAAVTTGTITPSTSENVQMARIERFSVTNDNDNATAKNLTANNAGLTLTFTVSDTGKYVIEGPAV